MTPRRGAVLAVVVIAATLTGCTMNRSPDSAQPASTTEPAPTATATATATPTPQPTDPAGAAEAQLPPLDFPKKYLKGELARDVGNPVENAAAIVHTSRANTDYAALMRCVATPGAEDATVTYTIEFEEEFLSGGTFDCTGDPVLNDVSVPGKGIIQVDTDRSDVERTAAFVVVAPRDELLELVDRE